MLEIGGQHGREIAVIKPFEERCALVIDIFLLAYQRSVHKHAALLFVGKGALGHEALDEGLDCFGAPCGRFHKAVCYSIDALTGATSSYNSFQKLSAAVVAQAQLGDSSIVLVDTSS